MASAPSRFPNGVVNLIGDNPFGSYVVPDCIDGVHEYYNDFDNYVAADWTVTEVNASGTEVLTDEDGGVLLNTIGLTVPAANDLIRFQKVGESFLMAAGKKAWFKTKVKTSSSTLVVLVFGLQITTATQEDPTDGIYFIKDADTQIDVVVRKDATTGSNRSNNVATFPANNTYIELAWYYDGKGNCEFWTRDVGGLWLKRATLDASSTFLPDTELTLSMYGKQTTAASQTYSVDYIMAAKER